MSAKLVHVSLVRFFIWNQGCCNARPAVMRIDGSTVRKDLMRSFASWLMKFQTVDCEKVKFPPLINSKSSESFLCANGG